MITRTALATLPAQGIAATLDRHRRNDWLVDTYTLIGQGRLIVLCRRIGRLAEKRRAYRLGWSGERPATNSTN